MSYSFQEQLVLGEEQEARLDDYFRPRFIIREATRDEQRQGIDRWFTAESGEVFPVEYKADFIAHNTGNAYIETVSVGHWKDGTLVVKKQGWIYTSRAKHLIYLVVDTGDAYINLMGKLKGWFGVWREKYRTVVVKNHGYYGEGLLVPLVELEEAAYKKVRI